MCYVRYGRRRCLEGGILSGFACPVCMRCAALTRYDDDTVSMWAAPNRLLSKYLATLPSSLPYMASAERAPWATLPGNFTTVCTAMALSSYSRATGIATAPAAGGLKGGLCGPPG